VSDGAFGVQLSAEWQKAAKIFVRIPDRFKKVLIEASMEEGEFMREKIVAQLDEADFPALSPLGALFGGGDSGRKPLAGFAQDVVVKRVGEAVFVGILPKGGGRGGRNRAELAELQEEGRTYSVTTSDRQRRYIMAILREGGVLAARNPHPAPAGTPLTINIVLPPRPFMQPTIDRWGKPEDVKQRFYERVARLMRGDLGLA
jgi:hypothetical protein